MSTSKRFPRRLRWIITLLLPLDVATMLLLCGRPGHSQAQSPKFEVGPTNAAGWFNQGNSFLSSNRYELATKSYSRALELQPDLSAALLNRAIAQLRGDQLDGAKNDYEDFLRRFSSTNHHAYFGLGEIAYQRKEWRSARENYERYLRYAPSNSRSEVDFVRSRLKELSAGKS